MLSEADLLRRLLVDSISTFCVLFRHALILHGEDGPPTKRARITRRPSSNSPVITFGSNFPLDPEAANSVGIAVRW